MNTLMDCFKDYGIKGDFAFFERKLISERVDLNKGKQVGLSKRKFLYYKNKNKYMYLKLCAVC